MKRQILFFLVFFVCVSALGQNKGKEYYDKAIEYYYACLLGDQKACKQFEKYHKKAVKEGYPAAQFDMGVNYVNGYAGLKQDYNKALEWFKKAAAQGHAEASYQIAMFYSFGHGVPIDKSEAVRWYEKAAKEGCDDAAIDLAGMYYYGDNVERDHATAMKWLMIAADRGNKVAMRQIGILYDEGGYGVERDYVEAAKWYKMASDKGDTYAGFALDRLNKILGPED